MGSHPINLGLRFVLELAALFVLGYWGSQQGTGVLSVVLAIGLPLIAAVLWGTFAVPDDPSRSGNAPVPVKGWIRLILELAFFVTAALALIDLGQETWGIALIGIVAVHYLVSYDRIAWLLRQ